VQTVINRFVDLNTKILLDKSVEIFRSPYELADMFAMRMIGMINESAIIKRPVSVALSGGTMPELFFSLLGDHYSNSVPWEYVHLFWVDERCVPPDDRDSNYGMTRRHLIDKIEIPSQNVHRIKGEEYPETESLRYSAEISGSVPERDGFPVFDLILLGLGADGHTASIFPGHLDQFFSDKICEVAVHPVTNKPRITLTGRVINNAGSIAFLVTGIGKAEVVEKIINKHSSATGFPASYIDCVHGDLTWFIDEEAGSLL
jgi:6-phosphogluconolactonase